MLKAARRKNERTILQPVWVVRNQGLDPIVGLSRGELVGGRGMKVNNEWDEFRRTLRPSECI